MSYQVFVNSVGFGSKGYALIKKDASLPCYIISGKSIDCSRIIKKIEKIISSDLNHIMIGDERKSLTFIKELSNELINNDVGQIFIIGGGSIIDFGKTLYLEIIDHAYRDINLIVLPSRIGSGAESSITSIINTATKKNHYCR